MIGFANAKINLGLQIVGKREDGYHLLETVFYPVGWSDTIEVLPSSAMHFDIAGDTIPGDLQDNLCLKAYRLLAADFTLPPVSMHLHKHIPIGAGLGGGSSDAVAVLEILNNLFDLKLDRPKIQAYALRLGADCAFFVVNKPCFATGIGEKLAPVSLQLQGYHLVVLKPPHHVSTAEAFASIRPITESRKLKEALEAPIDLWRKTVLNDFELSVFAKYPAIGKAKELLYQKGAIFALMSGTGSAVYGIFHEKQDVESWGWNQPFFQMPLSNS